ncbi:hypothetical protein [uncultured Dubosiella sp.]|uniref:hypothetical protein n=1 Tax=uncultured Dubosiella sp. TaxID=1937011 RepID=UPI0022CCD205|nr:hypothetical protein [uncultured Dubosiella sp.]MCZ2855910.1 hypothetical protein [Candidatus Bathyarchaeota archaeon]
MKLNNGQILDMIEGIDKILDERVSVPFAFKIASIRSALEGARVAIAEVLNRIEVDESGKRDIKKVNDLLLQEIDLDLETIPRSIFEEELSEIATRVILSLGPLIGDGDPDA